MAFDAMTAIGVGGSLIGGLLGSSSAKKAAKAQQQAAEAAQKEISRQFDTTRSDLAPWRTAGASALDRLQFLLGTGGSGSVNPQVSSAQNALAQAESEYQQLLSASQYRPPENRLDRMTSDPTGRASDERMADNLARQNKTAAGGIDTGALDSARARVDAARNALAQAQGQPYSPGSEYGSLLRPFSLDDFQVDPGYLFRQQEGNRAIENSAAARGMQLSGANLKGLQRFNSGLASQEYGAAFGRDSANKDRAYNYLSGVSGTGLGAASQTGAFGASASGSIADLMTQAGNAQAAGAVGSGNALSGALDNMSSYLQLQQLLRKG